MALFLSPASDVLTVRTPAAVAVPPLSVASRSCGGSPPAALAGGTAVPAVITAADSSGRRDTSLLPVPSVPSDTGLSPRRPITGCKCHTVTARPAGLAQKTDIAVTYVTFH